VKAIAPPFPFELAPPDRLIAPPIPVSERPPLRVVFAPVSEPLSPAKIQILPDIFSAVPDTMAIDPLIPNVVDPVIKAILPVSPVPI
jgi:hypothetical protein